MRLYTLSEVCDLFKISPATLRRWRHRSHIKATPDALNFRLRVLSAAQVSRLARDRRRMFNAGLESRVAALEQAIMESKKPPRE